ncbi:hypothetical protein BpHYR1_029936 [Brachionus plicatilis]|uniref:Uncharacterized protein n=1 Tax=Brachionus plicatilis TaxID=10195 RepID=A0A3M7QKC3_BRAPC|nr:hypothetical protein BpHYR1_029936 [Brachionus plicatilis]
MKENQFPANFGLPFLGLLTNSSDSHIILAHSENSEIFFISQDLGFVLGVVGKGLRYKFFSLWEKVFDLWGLVSLINILKNKGLITDS